MTQHNRETLLALAERLDQELHGLGLSNPYTNVRVVSFGLIDDILTALRARATLDPTGEKA